MHQRAPNSSRIVPGVRETQKMLLFIVPHPECNITCIKICRRRQDLTLSLVPRTSCTSFIAFWVPTILKAPSGRG